MIELIIIQRANSRQLAFMSHSICVQTCWMWIGSCPTCIIRSSVQCYVQNILFYSHEDLTFDTIWQCQLTSKSRLFSVWTGHWTLIGELQATVSRRWWPAGRLFEGPHGGAVAQQNSWVVDSQRASQIGNRMQMGCSSWSGWWFDGVSREIQSIPE